MKLPRRLQQELVQRCEKAVLDNAAALPPDSFLGVANSQGHLRQTLAGLLPPFAAEVGLAEGARLMALGKRYGSAQPDVRLEIESELRQLVLGVAARIPGASADWEKALDSVEVLARSFA